MSILSINPLNERTCLDPTKVSRPQKHLSLNCIIGFVTKPEEGGFKIDISSSYALCASAEREPENKVANVIPAPLTVQIDSCM